MVFFLLIFFDSFLSVLLFLSIYAFEGELASREAVSVERCVLPKADVPLLLSGTMISLFTLLSPQI